MLKRFLSDPVFLTASLIVSGLAGVLLYVVMTSITI